MTIITRLVKDGNSVAVRIPKTVLKLSGLQGAITMQVKQNQIILKPAPRPRSAWKQQIERVLAENPDALQSDNELSDWEVTTGDGIDEER